MQIEQPSSEPKVSPEDVAGRLVAIVIRRYLDMGLPAQALGDELLCAGAAILSAELGPAGAAECLRRAAAAAEEQIRG